MEYSSVMEYAEVVYKSRCLKKAEFDRRIEAKAVEFANIILEVFDVSTILENFIDSISIFDEDGEFGFIITSSNGKIYSNISYDGTFWRNTDRVLQESLCKIVNKRYDERILSKIKEIFDSIENYNTDFTAEDDVLKSVEIFIGKK